jgi:hypothetical protein
MGIRDGLAGRLAWADPRRSQEKVGRIRPSGRLSTSTGRLAARRRLPEPQTRIGLPADAIEYENRDYTPRLAR